MRKESSNVVIGTSKKETTKRIATLIVKLLNRKLFLEQPNFDSIILLVAKNSKSIFLGKTVAFIDYAFFL